MTAFSGATAAYVTGTGKPLQGRPGLTYAWDGAATPTLSVTETGDGTTCMKFSGQSLAGSASAPQALLAAAAPTGSPWGAGPA